MPCLLVILALALPRLVMFFIWLLTDWFSRAYGGVIIPLLGFLIMPYTTLAYMGAQLNGGLHGWWVILLIIAVMADVSGNGSAGNRVRGQRRGHKIVISHKID